MRSIDFEDAKSVWEALPDEVQQGRVVAITRGGKREAKLFPPDREPDREAARAAAEHIRQRRDANRPAPRSPLRKSLHFEMKVINDGFSDYLRIRLTF